MALQFELAGSQIDGARDYQEDAFLITHLTDSNGNPSALVIVADGMGGHAAGNVASNMAVQAFNKHVSANYPTDNPGEILRDCVIKANDSIKETVAETPALQGMGCTMVACILEEGKIWWASVGDSHVYLIRNKELVKLNADHSYGGFLDRMAAAGTPVEPEPGLSRNMLMSAITGDDINEIDVPEEGFELQPGDRVLLCSDGLDTLSAGKIIQFSEWSDSPKECSEALMQAVEDAGMPKQDNTTAVVVNIKEEEEAAPEPEPVPAAPAEPPVPEPAPGDVTQDISIADTEPATAGKTGLYVGIAAAVLVVVGVLALVMSGDKKAVPVDTGAVTVAEDETAGTGGEAIEAAGEAPVSGPAAGTAPATTVEAAPAPTVATSTGKEFSDKLKDGSAGPAMVWIPAGTFDMGSPGSSRFADERPRHSVTVDRFAIGKFEITFAEYEKFATDTGREVPNNLYLDKKTHPVIFVSWDDAYYYTKWLAKQTGKKYHLPSEAQWEYAAGTGKRSPFWWGFQEEPNRAHCFGCGTAYDPRKPTKVGSFKPNPFGVYDTAGNVSEWVHDCWHENYKDAPDTAEVWEGGDCAFRSVRGGAYSSPPQSLRHQKRDKFKSDQIYDHIGIRVVRDE